jgi:hypothetical protein
MATAFLAALTRWAARHSNAETRITIPVGTVNAGEVARVLRAIAIARRGSAQ